MVVGQNGGWVEWGVVRMEVWSDRGVSRIGIHAEIGYGQNSGMVRIVVWLEWL